ncbi:hypothetical protein Tco_1531385 [Tanacetum coccineum]
MLKSRNNLEKKDKEKEKNERSTSREKNKWSSSLQMKSLDAPLLLQTWFADEEETVDKENTIWGGGGEGTKESITATRKNFVSNDNEGRMVEKCIVEIQGTFLMKIRDYAFNGNIRENAFKHIDKFLEVVGPIKINGLTQDRFRLSVFPVLLAGAASEWFTKECIGSITTWDNMLNNDIAKGTEESWLENRVPYQLCDHICEPHLFKNGETKWPMCTSDIDGFCHGGKLPGMVRFGSITYFQDHMWYDELADGKRKDETLALKAKIEGSWGDATPEITSFTRMENLGRGPYANMKTEWTSNPYLDVNRIFERNYEASNVGDTQENQGHEEHKGNPNPEPSNCKIRRFEMMKYSFNDDEEYITIKESKHLNHSKDSLDAYREFYIS